MLTLPSLPVATHIFLAVRQAQEELAFLLGLQHEACRTKTKLICYSLTRSRITSASEDLTAILQLCFPRTHSLSRTLV